MTTITLEERATLRSRLEYIVNIHDGTNQKTVEKEALCLIDALDAADAELSECRLFIKGVYDAAEEAHWGIQDNQEYDPERRGRDVVRVPLAHAEEAITELELVKKDYEELLRDKHLAGAEISTLRADAALVSQGQHMAEAEIALLKASRDEALARTERAEKERDWLVQELASAMSLPAEVIQKAAAQATETAQQAAQGEG